MCSLRLTTSPRSWIWKTISCDVYSRRRVCWELSKWRKESAVKVLKQKRTVQLEAGCQGQHSGVHSVTHRGQVESPPSALFGDAQQSRNTSKTGRGSCSTGSRRSNVGCSYIVGTMLKSRGCTYDETNMLSEAGDVGSVGVDHRPQTAQCFLKGRRRGFGPAL